MEAITTKDIVYIIGLLTSFAISYGRITAWKREIDIRLTMVEKQDDKIIDKLDKIADQIADIKEDLSYKQDKE